MLPSHGRLQFLHLTCCFWYPHSSSLFVFCYGMLSQIISSLNSLLHVLITPAQHLQYNHIMNNFQHIYHTHTQVYIYIFIYHIYIYLYVFTFEKLVKSVIKLCNNNIICYLVTVDLLHAAVDVIRIRRIATHTCAQYIQCC